MDRQGQRQVQARHRLRRTQHASFFCGHLNVGCIPVLALKFVPLFPVMNPNGVKSGFDDPATTDEGVFEMEDDYGTSYYYRGAVENNYVKFAGFYWRIIRVNGDGKYCI